MILETKIFLFFYFFFIWVKIKLGNWMKERNNY